MTPTTIRKSKAIIHRSVATYIGSESELQESVTQMEFKERGL